MNDYLLVYDNKLNILVGKINQFEYVNEGIRVFQMSILFS